MLLFNNPDPLFLLGFLLAMVVAVTVHEFAHNYVAYQMGDPTPAELGKLTLNPLAHVWWPGWIMFLLIGFAPLGFAQMNPNRMRNPRWGYFYAVAAGPFSNLFLAVVFALIANIVFSPALLFAGPGASAANPLLIFLRLSVYLNCLLFMFNLLPLFPIDGWTMVYCLLPPDLAYTWGGWQQQTQYVLFGLIFLSFVPGFPPLLSYVVFNPATQIYFTLMGIG
ncbi:MAG: site-2 protease family protein [Chloroflexota bacterium]